GLIGTYRRDAEMAVTDAREGIAPFAPAAGTVTGAGYIAERLQRHIVAPGIDALAAGAQRILEFGLRWQAVRLPGALGQPGDIGPGIVPVHVHDGEPVGRGTPGLVVPPVDAGTFTHAARALVVDGRVPFPF